VIPVTPVRAKEQEHPWVGFSDISGGLIATATTVRGQNGPRNGLGWPEPGAEGA